MTIQLRAENIPALRSPAAQYSRGEPRRAQHFVGMSDASLKQPFAGVEMPTKIIGRRGKRNPPTHVRPSNDLGHLCTAAKENHRRHARACWEARLGAGWVTNTRTHCGDMIAASVAVRGRGR